MYTVQCLNLVRRYSTELTELGYYSRIIYSRAIFHYIKYFYLYFYVQAERSTREGVLARPHRAAQHHGESRHNRLQESHDARQLIIFCYFTVTYITMFIMTSLKRKVKVFFF
jgi:hypothetical protein